MDEDEKYKQAQAHVRRLRSFYMSLVTFIWVNLLLLVINLLSNPRELWFYWVTLIWGLVLIFQAINTFTLRNKFLGREWEEKKIKELMDKDKKK